MRVFCDSNNAMYAGGAEHPGRGPCVGFLRALDSGEIQAVTSTEVLQEILHWYHRFDRAQLATQVYALVVQLCAEVLPVTIADTDLSVDLPGRRGSVRDALHVAVMRNHDTEVVARFDAGLDALGVQPYRLGR